MTRSVYMYILVYMSIQYTIRNIPPNVDKALKKRAKISRKSFNQIVVDELTKTLKKPDTATFDWLANTMTKADAKKFDEAQDDLNKPDPDFWK